MTYTFKVYNIKNQPVLTTKKLHKASDRSNILGDDFLKLVAVDENGVEKVLKP